MSKRNIAYIKPQEPSFLRKLKEQIGYKEGPTVDTKRQALRPDDCDEEDVYEEQPTVVVLKPGDLSAEEAAQVKQDLEKEEAETPADLTARIVFKAPEKSVERAQKRASLEKSSTASKRAKTKKPILSFDDEDPDE
ncbi:uncharacterized protein CBL_11129 [Carabus blaptoides fortunei]